MTESCTCVDYIGRGRGRPAAVLVELNQIIEGQLLAHVKESQASSGTRGRFPSGHRPQEPILAYLKPLQKKSSSRVPYRRAVAQVWQEEGVVSRTDEVVIGDGKTSL